ncbi:hypothetical+protein [Methylocapsa aurea]|uniref:glycosyltransferase family 9 protein n=1 Tax=Methylocapsa aurea TaxID=663610 RepID=UPI003D18C68B
MKIAVVKPDHLGDFVIAVPAVRALVAKGHEVTLYIASGNFALARHYFADIELVALNLPHLNRKVPPDDWTLVYRTLGRLRSYDLTLFLRRDSFLVPENICQWTDYALVIEDRRDRHQSQLEQKAIAPVAGNYDIEKLFFGGASPTFPRAPKSVAFAIGTGFPFKKWSPLAWAELGLALRRRGAHVEILVGPSEIWEGGLIARAMGADDKAHVFVGSSDFHALEQWLANFDLVVAVDGGSAHLCSTIRPILSVFGPSPARRFAPIGSYNRIVTRDLGCSPCVGFDAYALNACMSRECLYGVGALDVLGALVLPSALPGQSLDLPNSRAVKVKFGSSAG